jgi:hypothetical protein
MTPEQTANARVGVELMTAWCIEDRFRNYYGESIVRLFIDYPDPDGVGVAVVKAIAGLTMVAGTLLARLADETGQTESEILQEISREFEPSA